MGHPVRIELTLACLLLCCSLRLGDSSSSQGVFPSFLPFFKLVSVEYINHDYICEGGARGVMVIAATRVQILDEADCISHNTNTLGKGMNPIILPLAMDK